MLVNEGVHQTSSVSDKLQGGKEREDGPVKTVVRACWDGPFKRGGEATKQRGRSLSYKIAEDGWSTRAGLFFFFFFEVRLCTGRLKSRTRASGRWTGSQSAVGRADRRGRPTESTGELRFPASTGGSVDIGISTARGPRDVGDSCHRLGRISSPANLVEELLGRRHESFAHRQQPSRKS